MPPLSINPQDVSAWLQIGQSVAGALVWSIFTLAGVLFGFWKVREAGEANAKSLKAGQEATASTLREVLQALKEQAKAIAETQHSDVRMDESINGLKERQAALHESIRESQRSTSEALERTLTKVEARLEMEAAHRDRFSERMGGRMEKAETAIVRIETVMKLDQRLGEKGENV